MIVTEDAVPLQRPNGKRRDVADALCLCPGGDCAERLEQTAHEMRRAVIAIVPHELSCAGGADAMRHRLSRGTVGKHSRLTTMARAPATDCLHGSPPVPAKEICPGRLHNRRQPGNPRFSSPAALTFDAPVHGAAHGYASLPNDNGPGGSRREPTGGTACRRGSDGPAFCTKRRGRNYTVILSRPISSANGALARVVAVATCASAAVVCCGAPPVL